MDWLIVFGAVLLLSACSQSQKCTDSRTNLTYNNGDIWLSPNPNGGILKNCTVTPTNGGGWTWRTTLLACVTPAGIRIELGGTLASAGPGMPKYDCVILANGGVSFRVTYPEVIPELPSPTTSALVFTPPLTGSEEQGGDPHFVTYDGLKFDAQTTCPFVISQPCNHLIYKGPYWSITAKNDLLPGKRVSMLSYIQLSIMNRTYSAEQRAKNTPLLFKLDGSSAILPFHDENVQANVSAGQIVIAVQIGLRIRFSWGRQRVTVLGKENYGTGVLCGMLGDFDGDCTNDLRGRDGKIYATPSKRGCRLSNNDKMKVEQFADTWIVGKSEQCMTGEELKNGAALPHH